MNIVKINVGQDIESVFKYKSIIEERLLKENRISESLNLDAFIEYLDFSKTIYIEGSKTTIPFCLYKIDESTTLLFHISDDEKLGKLFDALQVIMFNFSNLEKMTTEDMVKRDIESHRFFIINEEFYAIPE